MKAYDQGYEAYLDGEDLMDNPYPDWDENFEEWDKGFLDVAQKNSKIKKENNDNI